MSVQVTTAMVEAYSANVQHLVQQKGSRLRHAVRVEENVVGKNEFFDQIGVSEAQDVTSRHADTPLMDTPHSRRRVSLIDSDWGDLVDKGDKIRLLSDPTSEYAIAGANAMGRKMDDRIITAIDGTAFTGVDGSTATVFDINNIVDVQVRAAGVAAADLGLNVAKLQEAKHILDSQEVDEDDRFIAVNSRQLNKSLLSDTRATSADFATIKALVRGEIDNFMGFTFLRTERLGVDVNSDDKIPFWHKMGLLLAIGADIITDIGPRRDKRMATQVYVNMTTGATRMEEARVGFIECDPTTGPGA